jgi:hypothetical protein
MSDNRVRQSEITTVLIIEHPGGISLEGAVKQRNDADKAIAALGLEVVAAHTLRADARGMGIQMLTDPL